MEFGHVNDACLARLGWRAKDTAAFAARAARGLVPARVVLDDGRSYRVLGTFGETVTWSPSGRVASNPSCCFPRPTCAPMSDLSSAPSGKEHPVYQCWPSAACVARVWTKSGSC